MLAERYAATNTPRPEPVSNTPSVPLAPQTPPAKRPATPAAMRATFMSQMGGRSQGALVDNMKGMSIRQCVEKALLEQGIED